MNIRRFVTFLSLVLLLLLLFGCSGDETNETQPFAATNVVEGSNGAEDAPQNDPSEETSSDSADANADAQVENVGQGWIGSENPGFPPIDLSVEKLSIFAPPYVAIAELNQLPPFAGITIQTTSVFPENSFESSACTSEIPDANAELTVLSYLSPGMEYLVSEVRFKGVRYPYYTLLLSGGDLAQPCWNSNQSFAVLPYEYGRLMADGRYLLYNINYINYIKDRLASDSGFSIEDVPGKLEGEVTLVRVPQDNELGIECTSTANLPANVVNQNMDEFLVNSSEYLPLCGLAFETDIVNLLVKSCVPETALPVEAQTNPNWLFLYGKHLLPVCGDHYEVVLIEDVMKQTVPGGKSVFEVVIANLGTDVYEGLISPQITMVDSNGNEVTSDTCQYAVCAGTQVVGSANIGKFEAVKITSNYFYPKDSALGRWHVGKVTSGDFVWNLSSDAYAFDVYKVAPFLDIPVAYNVKWWGEDTQLESSYYLTGNCTDAGVFTCHGGEINSWITHSPDAGIFTTFRGISGTDTKLGYPGVYGPRHDGIDYQAYSFATSPQQNHPLGMDFGTDTTLANVNTWDPIYAAASGTVWVICDLADGSNYRFGTGNPREHYLDTDLMQERCTYETIETKLGLREVPILYGMGVIIRHDDNPCVATAYHHLQGLNPALKVGDHIEHHDANGDRTILGEMGRSGDANLNKFIHLHFDVRWDCAENPTFTHTTKFDPFGWSGNGADTLGLMYNNPASLYLWGCTEVYKEGDAYKYDYSSSLKPCVNRNN
ncbi:MAG: M23 family metallopeptidase [Patescibacteria group bacterium]